jgi:hypothetical protein
MGETDERMPKRLNRLSAVKVASTKKPGFYADGDGLYLQVTDGGSRSWVYRFKTGGRTRDMGLGSLNTVGLAEARGMAAEYRLQRLHGIDPIEARKSGACGTLRSSIHKAVAARAGDPPASTMN